MSEPTRQLPSDPSSAAVGESAGEVGPSHRAGWSDEFLGDAGGDLSAVLADRLRAELGIDAARATVHRVNAIELAKDRVVEAVREMAWRYEGRTVATLSAGVYPVLVALRDLDVAEGTDA
jgi:hypothetical protein